MNCKFTFRFSVGILALILGCTLIAGVLPQTAMAQDDGEDGEITPVGISPLSNRVSVLGFPLSVLADRDGDGEIDLIVDSGQIPIPRIQELEEITFIIEDRTEGRDGLGIDEDFRPLETSALSSGLALFKESNAIPDRFNFSPEDPSSDIPVNLLERPEVQVDPTNPRRFFVTMRPVPGTNSSQLPPQQTQFPNFYLVARTTLDLMHGDTFEVSIPANGIKVRNISGTPLPTDTVYDEPFPGDFFEPINPAFAEPSVFQGDLVEISSLIRETDNSNRIDISSEPKTLLGIDFVGRPDLDYFIKEVKVNFIGLNLASVARLIANLTQPEYAPAGVGSANFQTTFQPSFFYSPWFYNFPEDPENPGFPLTQTRMVNGEEVEFPVTMPIDFWGAPRPAFQFNNDDLNGHVTGYVPFGPRQAFTDGLRPFNLTDRSFFSEILPDQPGGVFLYREQGGQQSQFDTDVDRLVQLDSDGIRVETFPLSAEAIEENPGLAEAILRLLPGRVGGESGKRVLTWLFSNTNLAQDLLGVSGQAIADIEPEDPIESPRPPLGSLECTLDDACAFFDNIINISRPYLGLTEATVRYLNSLGDNEKSNMLDLFGFELFQAFTVTLPMSRDNAIGDLQAPNQRSGAASGPDLFVGVRTSDNMRSLDSMISFIQPGDITISTDLRGFTNGEDTDDLASVSSLGLGRPNTDTTFALIGRPSPRFSLMDMTTPGEGIFASNDNIMLDRSFGSPPKPVIGIDAVDFGQNPLLVANDTAIDIQQGFDNFFTESTVFAEVQIDFLPGTNQETVLPALFNVLPLEVGISQSFSFPVNQHSIAIYYDDDTPPGNRIDDDGDGLIDEELYNLQDDDGDGLIDEDIGDNTPRGVNGVFDSNDKFYPTVSDRWGVADGSANAVYVYQANEQADFEDFLTAIDIDEQLGEEGLDIDLEDGGLLPLDLNEGSWFTQLDLRALGYTDYFLTQIIFPTRANRPFNPGGPPEYNQGMYANLDPRTGLVDIFNLIWPGGEIYPEDFCIETQPDGEIVCMLTLEAGDENIPIIPPPDPGDDLAVRTSFLLSVANAMRFPNAAQGFVKVGNTPLVVGLPEPNNDLQPPDSDVITQFGWQVGSVDDLGAVFDYAGDVAENIANAYESVQDEIATYEEEVAAAEENVEEGEEPDYPDPPEPTEVAVADPFEALGMNEFNESLDDQTYQYSYQLQFPDENFGPLAGNDYFVVLRASEDATVGDSFRVRIRSGNLNNVVTVLEEDDGTTEQVQVPAPVGGIQYLSYNETDYNEEEPFRGVSKTQVTTQEIVIRSQNVSPAVSFQAPNNTNNLSTSDFVFEVVYTVEDPDSVPEVRLFVDDNKRGFDGAFLSGSLSRVNPGTPNSFFVDLQEQIPDFDPTQEYFIYARVDDGVNPPIFSYADSPIRTPATEGVDGGPGGGGGGDQIVVEGDLTNRFDYVKLSGDGRTFSLGETPSLPDVAGTGLVVDMETTPGITGMIAVQQNGTVLGFGDVGIFQGSVQDNGALIFPASDTVFLSNQLDSSELIVDPTPGQIQIENARDVEVDFLNGGIYVLDGDGDMLYLGNADTEIQPPAVGIDVYRDMEIDPTGNQLYFLAGNGMLAQGKGSPQIIWSDMVENLDQYPDMELATSEQAVTHFIITNMDGNITSLNRGGSPGGPFSGFALQPVREDEEITPGSVRQVKLFPGFEDVLLLIEGSGFTHYLSESPIDPREVPNDSFVFADDPGLDDDRITDVETATVNLQSVVESVRSILRAMRDENMQEILSFAAPDYFDRNGADLNGLQRSLRSLFSTYEVAGFDESRSEPNSFVLNNQGDRVSVSVILDFLYFYPNAIYQVPDVETGTVAASQSAYMHFVEEPPTIPQTVRIREVLDGRGWNIEIWQITDVGRQFDEIISEEPEFDDVQLLTRRLDNQLLGTYVPMDRRDEDPLFIDVPEDLVDTFQPYYLLFVFDEQFFNQRLAPPALEIVSYNGSLFGSTGGINVEFVFERQEDGAFKMTSMLTPQIIGENDQDFDISEGLDQTLIEQIDDLEVEQPFGFNFDARGPVITMFPGAADVVLTADGLSVTDPAGAIMMLREGTDIFSINPENFLQTISRTTLFTNPFDPEPTDAPGRSASLQPGRAYFVISRDGRHYGFIQLNEQQPLEDLADFELATFNYRYQDDFVLPEGF